MDRETVAMAGGTIQWMDRGPAAAAACYDLTNKFRYEVNHEVAVAKVFLTYPVDGQILA